MKDGPQYQLFFIAEYNASIKSYVYNLIRFNLIEVQVSQYQLLNVLFMNVYMIHYYNFVSIYEY